MHFETAKRSIAKTLSWRFWATLTTGALVYIFTGKLILAASIGVAEVVAKIVLYFIHERAWERIDFGKEEVPAFVLWFTGLPASGKTTLADLIHQELAERKLRVERLDSHNVRSLFPETGFDPQDVDGHIRRVGHLAAMLEQNGIIVVASFVSPYRAGREFARRVADNFIEVYLDTTPEASEKRDESGNYLKARQGLIKNFPGVNSPYETPEDPHLTVKVDEHDPEEAAEQVLQYLKREMFNGRW